jgi:hypothetical protein
MFDTNAFNHVLHGNIPLPALAGKRILSTRVQRDELNKTKEPPGRREELLEIFDKIAPEIMHASSFLFGVEGAGFDQACWNDGTGNFDEMLSRLCELDGTNKRKRKLDKEKLKLNQLRGSIAETAIKNGAILVSDNINLQQVVSESGGRAIGHLEFLSSTSRAAGWGAACDPFDETHKP